MPQPILIRSLRQSLRGERPRNPRMLRLTWRNRTAAYDATPSRESGLVRWHFTCLTQSAKSDRRTARLVVRFTDELRGSEEQRGYYDHDR